MQGARPTYKHETHNLYLFYKSWWKVDTEEAFAKEEETSGFMSAHDVAYCPEAIPAGSWQYYNKLAYQSQIVVTQGNHVSIRKSNNLSVAVPQSCMPVQEFSCKNPGEYFSFDSSVSSVGYVCDTG